MPKELPELKVDYDDSPINIIRKVNNLLYRYGYYFKDDGLPHDGYCIYKLIKH